MQVGRGDKELVITKWLGCDSMKDFPVSPCSYPRIKAPGLPPRTKSCPFAPALCAQAKVGWMVETGPDHMLQSCSQTPPDGGRT